MGADDGRGRPSWQPDPCPPWCTRVHLEDDHPEDRIHEDDGIVFPTVLAHTDPATLAREPVATELLVRRSQAIAGDPYVWVFIGELEAANRLVLAAEFVPQLMASLVVVTG